MTRILTVDDSRAVRMLVKKALADLSFEIDEAEDGEKGLLAIEQNPPDLILLDVTMPVLDGPGMLERLRQRRVTTPVLLLTAEAGTAVIGPMLKRGGVCEYIVKPFKPEQLKARVIEALQRNGNLAGGEEGGAGGPGGTVTGKIPIDVLVVDDMENVSKKLRTMLPERVTFDATLDRAGAMTFCRDRLYRAIILDMDIPQVNTIELMNDLRILQPSAAFVALVMRAEKNPQALVGAKGFAGFLSKPFDTAQVAEFVGMHFESGDLLQTDGNVLTPAAFDGPEAGAETFYRKVQQLLLDATQAAAAACHDSVILNLANLPPSTRLQKLLIRIATQCTELGLNLRIVAGPEIAKLLQQLVETASIPVVDNLDAAKAA